MASDKGDLDLTKYILASRTKVTRSGGGNNIKDETALEDMMKQGQFFEYWHVHIDNSGNAEALDGYILERRHENEKPMVEGEMSRQGDRWVADLSRPLAAGGADHKPILANKDYTVGFAIHSGFASGRYHHVSLEQTLRLDGGKADLVAKRIP
jgi:cytochrome c-type protein NapC